MRDVRLLVSSINWVDVPDGSDFEDSVRPSYQAKLNALRQYARGAQLGDIKTRFGISRAHLYYLVKRWFHLDIDGQPIEHRALLPYTQGKRTFAPTALAGTCSPGQLQLLFERQPKVRKALLDLVLDGKLNASAARLDPSTIKPKTLRAVLHDKAAECGVKAPDFPFVGKDRGLNAVERWAKKTRAKAQAERELTERKKRLNNPWTQPDEGGYPECLKRVECDGHSAKIDMLIRTAGTRGGNTWLDVPVSRIWFIPLLECKSSAILGYSHAFGKNYSAGHLACAINHALVPWRPRALSSPELHYAPGDGLPSGVDAELEFLAWDVLALDGAAAHHADVLLSTLERTVNCVIDIGPAAQPDVRAQVEGTFAAFQDALAELIGKQGRIVRLELFLDLLDLYVARYNNSICPGTSMTRLEVLRKSVKTDPSVVRYVPQHLREECLKYDTFDRARVTEYKGNRVVNWENAKYEGIGLAQPFVALGDEITFATASRDVRSLQARLAKDGRDLGTLIVEKRFRKTPHSTVTRRQAKATQGVYVEDIVLAVAKQAQAKASFSQLAAAVAARTAEEHQAGDSTSSTPPAAPTPPAAAEGSSVLNFPQRPRSEPSRSSDRAVLARIRKLGSTY